MEASKENGRRMHQASAVLVCDGQTLTPRPISPTDFTQSQSINHQTPRDDDVAARAITVLSLGLSARPSLVSAHWSAPSRR